MSRKKETRPAAGKHSGRAQTQTDCSTVERRCLIAYYIFLAALVVYGICIFLHDQGII